MPNVERNVVKAPNETLRSDHRANGFLPLVGGAPAAHPSNETGARGDHRGGSADLTGLAPMTKPPDHRFNVEDAKMPQPPAAFEPGKGAIPVNPFVPGGQGINRVFPEADTAKPSRPAR